MAWYDDQYRIKNVVREMAPPVGVRTDYEPGADGTLVRDRSRTVGRERGLQPPPTEGVPVGGEQGRLSALEAGMSPGVSTSPNLPQRPTQAVNIGGSATPNMEIPNEWKLRFDEAIAGLTAPSPELTTLRNQAQGYGLPMGKLGRQGQIMASKALSEIEMNRKTAVSHLARTMTDLMLKPQEYAKDIWGKQLEHGLGEKKLGIMERGAALEEQLLPERIAALKDKAPHTATGVGPGGEKVLYGWDPETKRWNEMTRGALPVEVGAGEALVDPTRPEKAIYENKSSKVSDTMTTQAQKEYAKRKKAIEDKYGMSAMGVSDQKRAEMEDARAAEEGQAWDEYQENLRQYGHPEFAASNRPSFAKLKTAAKAQGSKMSDTDLWKYYQDKYGR